MLPRFSVRSLGLSTTMTGAFAATLFWPLICYAQQGATDGEWTTHGGDRGMTRYSSLDQISAETLADLVPVWEWVTTDAPYLAEHANLRATNFEATPLEIDGVLYLTTSLQQASAIDAVSGETLWNYNPGAFDTSERARGGLRFINRGMAYWPGPQSNAPSGTTDPADLPRLFYATRNADLVALDLVNGEPIGSFGSQGRVDTTVGIPRLGNRRYFGNSSAPVVVGDVVVLGNRVSDISSKREMPPGYVRGYDVRTGKQLWEFHSVPLPGEPGNETWENDSWQRSGNTNVWGLISADPELGYVYLPFGTPTNDFYGGDRPGDNLYAESLVCLDAATGEMVWYFQAVHHGLWDYDLPAPPILFDRQSGPDGETVKALALVTKHGFTFVFDRTNGRPVWPIEERPVPQSTVPGERTAATQPFPTKPPPFERLGVTVDDLIDFTPELRAEAIEILERYEYGPIFTPPSLKGTLLLPSYGGGANWPGAALDPESNTLFVPSMTRPLVMQIVEPDPSRSEFRFVRGGETAVEGPRGLPLIKPPYGRVTAIDLNEGEILWTVPNGGDGPIDHEAIAHLKLDPLGTPTRAGVLVTRTLLFVTEGAGRTGSAIGGGNYFRALDKKTGKELWRHDLGGHATGVPMTYEVSGRQYVAVAVGSDPPQLVAFGLKN